MLKKKEGEGVGESKSGKLLRYGEKEWKKGKIMLKTCKRKGESTERGIYII